MMEPVIGNEMFKDLSLYDLHSSTKGTFIPIASMKCVAKRTCTFQTNGKA